MADTFPRTEVFRDYVDSTELPDPIRSIAELLASSEFSSASFDRLLVVQGLTRKSNIQESLLDLALVFVRRCVDDHKLDVEELNELENIVETFRIDADDFQRHRGEAIKQIVYAQAVWILEDELVTEEEEIRQNDLQRLFGFGYDQYVSLLRPLAKQHIKRLQGRLLANPDLEEVSRIEASIQNLRSVFLVQQ